ncbi:MAG: hypothetical protein ACOYO1_02620 [Bacteroidales bacterium]
MKKIKPILISLLFIALVIAINACKDCDGDNPRARIVNNGTKEISVQIKTSGGNTENVNNIQPDVISEYRSFAPGITTFTIVVGKDNYVTIIQLDECFEYNIEIDKNNVISTTSRDRND